MGSANKHDEGQNEDGQARQSKNEQSENGQNGDEPTRWSRGNWLIIGLFFLLTVLGVIITTGELRWGVVDTSSGWRDPVAVPGFVYLFASLGALGYVFTRLITQLDEFVESGNVDQLAEMALRIPAAWVLASGVYLFLPVFVPESTGDNTAWFAAGISFLVGLYVNVAFKSLGGLAERLLGRTGNEESEESKSSTESEESESATESEESESEESGESTPS